MINEPIFQDNILSQIWSNLYNYFTHGNWTYYTFTPIIIITLIAITLKKQEKQTCWDISINKDHSKLNLISKIYFCFSIIAYTVILFSQENSLFNNYDLMSFFTTRIFTDGLLPHFNLYGRLSPFANFDSNFIYAITHNYDIINFYILAQIFLIVYLLYKFLDFIEINKRIFLISTFIISPCFFWTNNFIFYERWIVIFIISSLIFYKKSKIIPFVIFMNLAIYLKESNILIYAGMLSFLCGYKFYKDEIKISTFIHPIKSIKQMPYEVVIFISCLFFAIIHNMVIMNIDNNIYLSSRKCNYFDLIWLYKTELLINIIALIYFIKNIKNKQSNCLNSLLLSATFFNIFLIFIIKLITVGYHLEHKTYYLTIPTLINLIYIFTYSKTYKTISVFLLLIFIPQNIYIYSQEQGKEYREIYEYFTKELETKDKLSIFVSKNNTQSQPWIMTSWASSFKYYLPNKDITFKMDLIPPVKKEYFHKIKKQEKAQKEEYAIIKKNQYYNGGIQDLGNLKRKKVFENKLFEIFYIKE
ncbi:MAG: hypothetical protein R3Y43_02570 [Alphaproteobacteria bacterium]